MKRTTPRTALTLSTGLVVSLALHMTVLAPALVALMSATSQRPTRLRARFKPQDLRTPIDPATRLGIDAPTPATLTWIGYDEYQQHLAALSEVEQAAFRSSPAGSPLANVTASASDTPADAESTDAAAHERSITETLAALEQWLDSLEAGRAPDNPPGSETPSRGPTLAETLRALEQAMAEPSESRQPDIAARPGTKPTLVLADQDPGALADKESDPTSTVDVPLDRIRLGRPLAAHGLQILPRKPSFTTLQLLTAAPRNPRCEIRFRRDGVPTLGTRILEGSGDPRIDEAILNSLYRWRASGDRLDDLRGDETISIRLRILLIRKGG